MGTIGNVIKDSNDCWSPYSQYRKEISKEIFQIYILLLEATSCDEIEVSTMSADKYHFSQRYKKKWSNFKIKKESSIILFSLNKEFLGYSGQNIQWHCRFDTS